MRVSAERATRRISDSPATVPVMLVALVVVGGLLRLSVARQDLFADELATYWIVSTHGLGGVVRTVSTTAEISPPLGFVLSWVTTRMGLSSELVRLPALVAGIGSIPLVYAVGIRTVGRRAALLAAALTTLSPFMIFYSAEARGYGVLMALVLLSTLALLRAIDDGRWGWWAAYGAFVCLVGYTHYTAVYVLAAQFAWAFLAYPRARKPLLIATSAAVLLYLPWLPSLKGDVDSPTTRILDGLSPFTLASSRITLEHWTIGFPYSFPGTDLSDLPGIPALLLLAACVCVGTYGICTTRSRLGRWFAGNERRVMLVFLLALATPVGSALTSAVGTNVFSPRNLAASWPYLALAGAALVTVGRPSVRIVAAALATAAFALGAATMVSTDFQRPGYRKLAQFAEEQQAAVLVDGAAVTPGPLTNFDVEGSTPGVPVFRLGIPEQKTIPFAYGQPIRPPAVVAQQAVAAARGGPIIVIADAAPTPATKTFLGALPPEYSLTHRELVPGINDLEALVYERGSG